MHRSCRKNVKKVAMVLVAVVTFVGTSCFGADAGYGNSRSYNTARDIGKAAVTACMEMINGAGPDIRTGTVMVITNAGYAEIDGMATQGALDGICEGTGASRGKNTLVEVQSAPWAELWVAVYDFSSGYCGYVEVDVAVAGKAAVHGAAKEGDLFSRKSVTRIDADYVYGRPEEVADGFSEEIFGGNEFRILTIANAVAAGAPPDAVRAFEFHDHYCPGVTSGILIAGYAKKQFFSLGGGYFVHSVSPWCKEDALMVLLNATPGKKGYAVAYPTDADLAKRDPAAVDADTILYRENPETGLWEGRVLAFRWAETSCLETGNTYVDKLCSDLWYLEHMDTPEAFVVVVKAFEMPEGLTPKDWAGPGDDPLEMLGLLKEN